MSTFKLLWVLCMFLESVELGKPFSCFHCHQTSKQCNNGDKMILKITDCTSNACFVLKYETEMPGVNVLATFRGCFLQTEQEILSNVKTENHQVSKKYFRTCNSSLCNSVDTRTPFFFLYTIIFMLILLFDYGNIGMRI